jgi:cellulose synthase/poly-beta-1,6-N-acetylglucosamine synthase-like glycosyltransferase
MVPAHNEEDVIGMTLRSLARQTTPAGEYEVVVIDDGSSDSTAKMVERAAKKYPKVIIRLVRKKKAGGKSSALNRGIREVKGEYILITDADIVVSPNWIEVMSKGLDEYDMVQGAWFAYRPKGFFQKIEHAQMLAEYRYGGLYIQLTRNGANNGFRRKVYDRAGPFDEKSTVVTQGFYQRGLDGGFSLTYLRESAVFTHANSRFGTYAEQKLRWREYDSAASVMRSGAGGFIYTTVLSLIALLTLFVLPFLGAWFPLLLDRFIPWWGLWHLFAVLLLMVVAADLARYMPPMARMRGKGSRPEDRPYAGYLMGLVPVLFVIRLITVPWLLYRLARPRRSGAFDAPRD